MIVIYGIRVLKSIKLQLSNVLQQCLNSEMGLPDDKRAHRFVAGKEMISFLSRRADKNPIPSLKSNMMEVEAVNTRKQNHN